ncbi:MAG: hypothetical protein ABSC41_06440 [Acidimicrobiales bacterium]
MSGRHRHRSDGGGPDVAGTHPFDPSDPETPRAGATVAEGVIELDTLLGGWARVTAGYLIEGDSPVLVETGSQSSVPVLLAQLDRLGVGASDLAGVVVIRPGWSIPPPGSTAPSSTRSTAGSTPHRLSGSTCWRISRRSG